MKINSPPLIIDSYTENPETKETDNIAKIKKNSEQILEYLTKIFKEQD